MQNYNNKALMRVRNAKPFDTLNIILKKILAIVPSVNTKILNYFISGHGLKKDYTLITI